MSANSIWEMSQPTIASAGIMSNFNKGRQDQNLLMQQALQNQQIQQQMAQDSLMNPMRLAQAGQVISGEDQRQQMIVSEADQVEKARITSSLYKGVQALKPFLAKGELVGAKKAAALFTEYGLPPEVEAEALQMLDSGDIDGINRHIQAIDALGLDPSLKPAGIREFEYMTQGMTPEQKAQARLVATGQAARAGDSAAERIARTGQTEAVAASEAVIKGAQAGAAEEAELSAQQRMLPAIRAQIKRAELEATAQGETVTTLTRAKAALPGLLDVSDKLKKLADVATYTTTGRLFDLAAKELGFGSTKGGTARSSMTSIVDNQVLPLLRDTFGAAFTAAEGDKLRDSLLDPDASPEAKKATLDAFIDQKYRNIETQERELGISGTPNQPARIKFDAQGNVIQ